MNYFWINFSSSELLGGLVTFSLCASLITFGSMVRLFWGSFYSLRDFARTYEFCKVNGILGCLGEWKGILGEIKSGICFHVSHWTLI